MLQDILGPEHAAPGLSEQVVAGADAELIDQGGEFVDEQLHRPASRVPIPMQL